jgi:PAS domain S-box-containing protein
VDPRFEKINSLLISYSLGDFNQKIKPSSSLDEIDAFITNVNMLGEELKISTISRNYFNNIFYSVSDMLFVLDPSGSINSVNRAVEETLRFKEKELGGRSIDIIEGGDSDFFRRLKKRMNKSDVVHLDRNMLAADKTVIPVNCTCSFLYNQHREAIGYLLIARDQTKIKQYERSLIESEKKYREVFEASTDCLYIIDADTNFKDINEAGIRLFKYPREVLKKMRMRELVYDNRKRLMLRKQLDDTGEVVDFEMPFIDANKTIIPCLISAKALFGPKGELIGWQGIVKDMSQHKKMESMVLKAMVDTQEKERIRIARDIHDSLGQKLSGIRFYLGALNSMQEEQENLKHKVLLKKSNDALNDVLSELSNISFNLMPGTLQHFGLKQAVNELCHKIELGAALKITLTMSDEVVIADKTIEISLFRIIQEFINNSLKHAQASKITVKVEEDKTGNITVVLKDNGKGFQVQSIKNFTGMGLKNVNSRVESHSGTLKINSIVGKGTTYEITIPGNK